MGCVRCPLHETRTTVVFGAGNADAELMFIGEAPGANEDKQGLPFVGQAGKLLDKLLAEIGMERRDVFVLNVLKCRPPGNRDPHPAEIESCQDYLWRQVELIEPTVICTLGNFSTKLLRRDGTGISRLHGVEEVRIVGGRAVRLYPLFHPAAALYTPRMLETLRTDFRRLPEVLALGPPPQPRVGAEPALADGRGLDAAPALPDVGGASAELAQPDLLGPIPELEPEQQSAPIERKPAAQLGLF
jgi:DNA polymerase